MCCVLASKTIKSKTLFRLWDTFINLSFNFCWELELESWAKDNLAIQPFSWSAKAAATFMVPEPKLTHLLLKPAHPLSHPFC